MSFTLVKKIIGYIKQLVVNVDSETNKYSYCLQCIENRVDYSV